MIENHWSFLVFKKSFKSLGLSPRLDIALGKYLYEFIRDFRKRPQKDIS